MSRAKGVKPYAETYLRLGEEPQDDELLCAFRVTPRSDVSIEEAAAAVAAESSTGTWTEVDAGVAGRLQARVYRIKDDLVLIAYPQDLFEYSSMPNILSSVAGNVFGMLAVDGLRLEDIRFPEAIVRAFPGPAYGLDGVRERMGIYGRAMSGSTIKPKIGLTAAEHANVCYETWMGGVDTVKDDENLGSQSFNDFYERIALTLEMLHKAQEATGERKGYWANVTAADTDEMIRRAGWIKENGGIFAMVDYITVGYAGVASLRTTTGDLGLMLHAHRAMHAALDRIPSHGIEYRVLAKAARLQGVDHIHTGTGVGKLEGGPLEMKERQAVLRDAVSRPVGGLVFEQDWHGTKPVVPVASGGLHPGLIPALDQIFGTDAFFAFGGGVHGHPQGSRAGAMAVRAALEAVAAGRTLDEAATESRELRQALDLWEEVKFSIN
jgi:ribulose-bisphosphate carboxylase large chain